MQSFIAKRVIQRSAVAPLTQAYPAMNFVNKFSDKEKGDEKVHFNKEDEKLLKNLIKKMQTQAKQSEKAPEEVE